MRVHQTVFWPMPYILCSCCSRYVGAFATYLGIGDTIDGADARSLMFRKYKLKIVGIFTFVTQKGIAISSYSVIYMNRAYSASSLGAGTVVVSRFALQPRTIVVRPNIKMDQPSPGRGLR